MVQSSWRRGRKPRMGWEQWSLGNPEASARTHLWWAQRLLAAGSGRVSHLADTQRGSAWSCCKSASGTGPLPLRAFCFEVLTSCISLPSPKQSLGHIPRHRVFRTCPCETPWPGKRHEGRRPRQDHLRPVPPSAHSLSRRGAGC